MVAPNQEMAIRTDFDTSARQVLLGMMRLQIFQKTDGNKAAIEGRAGDAYVARHGKRPATAGEINEALSADPYYQMWSSLQRTHQDLMWVYAEEAMQADMPRLKEVAKRYSNRPSGGSLTIDENFAPPPEAEFANIHGQFGGFLRKEGEEDFSAGAIQSASGMVFAIGKGLRAGDSCCAGMVATLKKKMPSFAPKDILDLGCGAGGSSMDLAKAFPEARVRGVDVGEGLVRYAHLRAESLGIPIDYYQMDAASLTFEDNSMDFVTGSLILHEASPAQNANIMAEAYRVLRPGGLMAFAEVPWRLKKENPFDRAIASWQTVNNDEPYWDMMLDTDLVALARNAGFKPERIEETGAPMLYGPRTWYVILATK